jgi:uncharacterized membrane protein YgcG
MTRSGASRRGSDARGSASAAPRRLAREERTLAAMVALYCRDHHGPEAARDAAGACAECAELLAYARLRLERCRYGAEKPTCAVCPTHCYKPAMRERVREVMRYSGPRMLRVHPVLAVAHLVDGRRRGKGGAGRSGESDADRGGASGAGHRESGGGAGGPA